MDEDDSDCIRSKIIINICQTDSELAALKFYLINRSSGN